MQATQNFSIGVILDAESDGIEIFWKLGNFTILRNKVRVQPFLEEYQRVASEVNKTVAVVLINIHEHSFTVIWN